MAKLSARGRRVLAGVVKEYNEETLQRQAERFEHSAGKPSLTVYERKTKRLMSDGTILEKRDVTFRPSPWEREPHRHSYGWKVAAKLKDGVAATAETAEKWTDQYIAKGFTRESGTLAAPVKLSLSRIERAVSSGESVGFCLECGDKAYGVEPDAHGYKCESCGAMAVSGAEECLLSAV